MPTPLTKVPGGVLCTRFSQAMHVHVVVDEDEEPTNVRAGAAAILERDFDR